jgi:signal transduction histidine kinase
LEASDGSIYVGTSNGLNHLNPETEKFTRFLVDRNDPHSISNNTILTIYEDSDSFIWIGTQGGGLNRFDPKSRRFFHYKNNLRDSLSISSNTVHAIYEFPFENRPTLWIGTKGGGLCRLDEETGQFFTYSKMDGLPGNQVEEIITDKKGNFWLATVDNITMFNPEEVIFKNYELSAEMPVNPHACLIDQDGEIFFGGSCGMVRFHPDSLKDNPYQPPVVITKLRVNNQPAQLDTVITEKNRLVLSYNQNNLTFEFSALDFNRPEMNQYAYKLEGLDKTWVYTDASRRYAAYTYIDPGKYVFQIKGSNNDGVWNEEGTSLTIIITPPWWRTNLAYGLYFILAISFLYSAWRVQMSRIKMKHDLEIEHLHAEKLEEVDRMKSHFFANISHEFRTPLTLILGPLEHLLSCYTDEDSRQNLKIMKRSAKRLKRLISQLLDLSKLETGQWKLRVKEENIVTLLRGYVQAFESLAKLKNIKLIFKADQNNILAYIDREKLETIINNLLSNAFKFTREGGAVSIDFGLRNEELEDKSKIRIPRLAGAAGQAKSKIAVISISDTGCGIPAESLPHIFDRFYQAGDTYTREQEGTGIGLALTKELVEFHKGKISVTSTVGKGTTFVIHLPLEKEAYTSGEIADTTIPVILPIPVQEDKPVREIIDLESWPDHEIKKTGKKFLPLLLVVEDNHDMRTYIRSNMENDYRIIEAEDGEEGFNRSIKAIPDLIISDVMMPKMDGFALCAKLKEDERTSHIPIILLSPGPDWRLGNRRR